MNNIEQQTDLCFEADYLSLGKPEYGRWSSYQIKLDSLPPTPVENSDQEPLDFIVKLFRECQNIALLSFTMLADGRFRFTSELSLEIITAARQAGLTHIRAYHVEPPFTVKDVYRDIWNKIFSLDCFTTDLDLTSQQN